MSRAASSLTPQSQPGFFERLVNSTFRANHRNGERRNSFFSIALAVFWIGLAILLHSSLWQPQTISNIIYPPEGTNPVLTVLGLLVRTFFALDVLAHLIAIVLPFWLAMQLASIYLADIFELRESVVARRFLTQAAFADPDFLVLHLEEGDIRRADKDSPLAKIGGPGNIQINLENAAVFDRVDGSCKIVGPTFDRRWGVHTLEGFERLRQVIDLRDQVLSFEVTGRTKDGIRIAIQDVRLIFSIQRNTSDPRRGQTYAFNRSAVYDLIFRQGYQSGLVPQGPQSEQVPWTDTMNYLVKGELINFISEYTLGELLAAVEDDSIKRQVEKENFRQRYLVLLHRHGYFTRSRGRVYLPIQVSPRRRVPTPFLKHKHKKDPYRYLPKIYQRLVPQRYAPRTQLSSLFYSGFTRGFSQRARQRGVRLEWINVGTWHPLAEIIPSQHLEAFRLTVETNTRGNPRVLESLKRQNRIQESIRLVRQTPIYAFLSLYNQELETTEVVYQLISEYLGKLRVARSTFKDQGRFVPPAVQNAIAAIQLYQEDYVTRMNYARKI